MVVHDKTLWSSSSGNFSVLAVINNNSPERYTRDCNTTQCMILVYRQQNKALVKCLVDPTSASVTADISFWVLQSKVKWKCNPWRVHNSSNLWQVPSVLHKILAFNLVSKVVSEIQVTWLWWLTNNSSKKQSIQHFFAIEITLGLTAH